MTGLHELLGKVASDLDESAASWALVGGLAVGTLTEPRFTRDLDVAVAVADDSEAESVTREMLARGYKIVALVEQTAVKRLATVRLAIPGDERLVDLLFASSGIEPEIVEDAQRLCLTGSLEVPVARAGHLFAMKVLARDDQRRPQDRVDLAALLPLMKSDEHQRARRALDRIRAAGFHRGRDLQAELTAVLEELGASEASP